LSDPTLRPACDADRARISELAGEAFAHADQPLADPEALALEDRYVVEVGGVVVASLTASSCGQWFGGRSVSARGLRGVCVASEHRGSGIGTVMLTQLLQGLATSDVGVSSLYPSLVGPYRKAGYEVAGRHDVLRAAVGAFRRHPGSPPVEVWTGDLAELQTCYAASMSNTNGPLDRTDSWWQGRVVPAASGARRYVHCVRESGRVTGYVSWCKRPAAGALAYAYDIEICDRAWTTRSAADALSSWVLGHGGLGHEVVWPTMPGDPWLDRVEGAPVLGTTRPWMLRLVNVPVALTTRGYDESITASVLIEVTDTVVQANAGTWRLDVAGGRAALEPSPATSAAVQLGVGSLSALYSGHESVTTLHRRGLLRGPAEALRALGTCFPVTGAWLTEMF